jgi:pterin-4a-carbinolamine dehydratase
MKSLVELVVNGQKNTLKEFNMSGSENSLVKSLRGNFPYNFDDDNSLPVNIDEKPSWDVVQNNDITYLNKTYRFGTTKHMLYFINEAIELSKKHSHFPEMIIKENNIEVNLFTKDIFDVTEIDKKLSKSFDEIFEEIKLVYHG